MSIVAVVVVVLFVVMLAVYVASYFVGRKEINEARKRGEL